jgi:hypothetical protein
MTYSKKNRSSRKKSGVKASHYRRSARIKSARRISASRNDLTGKKSAQKSNLEIRASMAKHSKDDIDAIVYADERHENQSYVDGTGTYTIREKIAVLKDYEREINKNRPTTLAYVKRQINKLNNRFSTYSSSEGLEIK